MLGRLINDAFIKKYLTNRLCSAKIVWVLFHTPVVVSLMLSFDVAYKADRFGKKKWQNPTTYRPIAIRIIRMS